MSLIYNHTEIPAAADNFTSPELFEYYWNDFKQNFYPSNSDAWLNNRWVVEHFTNYMKENDMDVTAHVSYICLHCDLLDRSRKLPSPGNRQKIFSLLWDHWSYEHHAQIKFYHYDFLHCLHQFEEWVAFYIPSLEGNKEFKKFCDELATYMARYSS